MLRIDFVFSMHLKGLWWWVARPETRTQDRPPLCPGELVLVITEIGNAYKMRGYYGFTSWPPADGQVEFPTYRGTSREVDFNPDTWVHPRKVLWGGMPLDEWLRTTGRGVTRVRVCHARDDALFRVPFEAAFALRRSRPWEAFRHPLDERGNVHAGTEGAAAKLSVAGSRRVKVLLVAASPPPGDENHLANLASHVDPIVQMLEDRSTQIHLRLLRPEDHREGELTSKGILDEIRGFRPDVLILIGHGSPKSFYWSATGTARQDQRLVYLELAQFCCDERIDPPALVITVACKSGDSGEWGAVGARLAPAIVAINGEFREDATQPFFEEFLEKVLKGQTLPSALRQAIQRLTDSRLMPEIQASAQCVRLWVETLSTAGPPRRNAAVQLQYLAVLLAVALIVVGAGWLVWRETLPLDVVSWRVPQATTVAFPRTSGSVEEPTVASPIAPMEPSAPPAVAQPGASPAVAAARPSSSTPVVLAPTVVMPPGPTTATGRPKLKGPPVTFTAEILEPEDGQGGRPRGTSFRVSGNYTGGSFQAVDGWLLVWRARDGVFFVNEAQPQSAHLPGTPGTGTIMVEAAQSGSGSWSGWVRLGTVNDRCEEWEVVLGVTPRGGQSSATPQGVSSSAALQAMINRDRGASGSQPLTLANLPNDLSELASVKVNTCPLPSPSPSPR